MRAPSRPLDQSPQQRFPFVYSLYTYISVSHKKPSRAHLVCVASSEFCLALGRRFDGSGYVLVVVGGYLHSPTSSAVQSVRPRGLCARSPGVLERLGSTIRWR